MISVTIDLSTVYPELSVFLGEETTDSTVKDAFVAGLAESLFLDFWSSYFVRSYGGVDDLGNQWDPLAPSTIRRKGHDYIMRREDTIMSSLWPNTRGLQKYFPGHNQLFDVGVSSLTLGTLVHYAPMAEAAGPGREIIPSNWELWLPAAIQTGRDRSQPYLPSRHSDYHQDSPFKALLESPRRHEDFHYNSPLKHFLE